MPKFDFKTAFSKSIQDAKAGRLSALLALALHPHHQILGHIEPGARLGQGCEHLPAWMGSHCPWLGAGLWALPKSLEQEMMKAECGALFSHGHFKAEHDQAFIEHLGPLGAQVSGCAWNSVAFESEGFPIAFCIGSFDIRAGRRGNRMAGMPRPTWWPEPLPMIERLWSEEDSPEKSPNFAEIALILAKQIRQSAAEAIHESTGASAQEILEILGGVASLPASAAKHFGRQEHPMFGAPRLEPKEREEALIAVSAARAAFEKAAFGELPAIPRASGSGPRL